MIYYGASLVLQIYIVRVLNTLYIFAKCPTPRYMMARECRAGTKKGLFSQASSGRRKAALIVPNQDMRLYTSRKPNTSRDAIVTVILRTQDTYYEVLLTCDYHNDH